MGPSGPVPQDVEAFITSLDEVDLARFRVVGAYARYDQAVRNALQDARQRILAGFEPPGGKRENHLIWAAPGTGKTYFIQQVAASLPDSIRYQELNLAKCTEPEFRSGLGILSDREACLCLVDEIDAKPQEPWPYEVLLPYLDAAVERGAQFVFVLAGSSGASLEEIKQRIAARAKGADLLSRIPTGHEYVIGPMSLGDRVLIVLSQLRQAGLERGREIRSVEKLGLYYVALNQRLANARQLREFAVRAVERVPKNDDRVKYDHLFIPGDSENKAFWVQCLPVVDRLANNFVRLVDDQALATPPNVRESTRSALDGAGGFPSTTINARPRTNLPRQLTSFIGREREIAEVKRLLPTTGLLTITGVGGAGKTRLALRAAADLLDHYPDGVWLAQLASLSEETLVPKAVASALDIPEQPGRPLTETVADNLRAKALLIVLDNCEHLLQACANLVDTLLRASPHVRVLATSREVLGIEGELIYRIPSLSVPDLKRLPPPDGLTQYEAVRLFVERAAFSKPGFEITSGNAGAVAQVAHRLDGIPLAIELAAARVKALPIDAIAERLDDRFRLLVGGSRTGTPRHQTLRATLDWSYDLLSEQERTLLRRLSVFAGGCTLEAAESITAREDIPESDILDLLTRLVDKSLVIFDERDGHARYRLPETVQQYAREKLAEGRGVGNLRRCHRDWYLNLTEDAAAHLDGPAMSAWLKRLEHENDNLRAALEWSASDTGNQEAGLRLAVAMARFWEMHGHFTEGRRWLESLLTPRRPAPPHLQAAALNAAGILAYRQGDYPKVAALCSEALALCQAHGDRRGTGRSLHFLAHLIQARGDYAGAAKMMERSVALHREAGNAVELANSVDCSGEIARSAGDYERAKAYTEEALALYSAVGHVRGRAHLLHNLAYLRLHEGKAGAARALFRESLVLARETGSTRDEAFAVAGLACASLDEGVEAPRAIRLLGAAEALLNAVEIQLEPAENAEFRRSVEVLRARVDPATFEAVWAEGRAMTLEQAIEYALTPDRSAR